jgi:hypothetical protein
VMVGHRAIERKNPMVPCTGLRHAALTVSPEGVST